MPLRLHRLLLFAGFAFLLFSCRKEQPDTNLFLHSPDRLPHGFPAIVYPAGNEFTADRFQLGKKLFYDKRLSKNNTISCGSCHSIDYAFADNRAVSAGDLGAIGSLNTPSLANVAWFPYYTIAGGVSTLEMQVLVPIQEHSEFNSNMLVIVEKLKDDPFYRDMSLRAYDRAFDPYVITRALANFERTIVSGDAPFDAYFYRNREQAISPAAKRGYELFSSGKTNCSSCHSGFNFTNYAFENNGLSINYSNPGRRRITERPEDEATFKVPGLRNVALTAPYMHNGSINSLRDVIEHYNQGGVNHPSKSKLIRPLKLTRKEKEDLHAFLMSLTDYRFIRNKNLQP